MRAVDTNGVVRFITGEPFAQAERARSFFMSGRVHLSITVLLETEWVLRRVIRLPKARVLSVLSSLSGLPNVVVETPERLVAALASARAGCDFADALHLASAQECERLATFDRRFVARAAKLGAAPPVLEP